MAGQEADQLQSVRSMRHGQAHLCQLYYRPLPNRTRTPEKQEDDYTDGICCQYTNVLVRTNDSTTLSATVLW